MTALTPYDLPNLYPHYVVFSLADNGAEWVRPECREVGFAAIGAGAGGGSGAKGSNATTLGGGGGGGPGAYTALFWLPAWYVDPILNVFVGDGGLGAAGVTADGIGLSAPAAGAPNGPGQTFARGTSTGITFCRTNPGVPGKAGTLAAGGAGGEPSGGFQPFGTQPPGGAGGFGSTSPGPGRANGQGPASAGGGGGHLAGGPVQAGGIGNYGAITSVGQDFGFAAAGATNGQAGQNGANLGTEFLTLAIEILLGGGSGAGGASSINTDPGGRGGDGGIFGAAGGGGGSKSQAVSGAAASGAGGNGAPGALLIVTR